MQTQQKSVTAVYHSATIVIKPEQGSFELFTSKDKNYQDLALEFFSKEVFNDASDSFKLMTADEHELTIAAAFEDGYTEDETNHPMYVVNSTIVVETDGSQAEVDYWIVANLENGEVDVLYSKKTAFDKFLDQAQRSKAVELEDRGDPDDIYGQSYPKLRQSFDNGKLVTNDVFVFNGKFSV